MEEQEKLKMTKEELLKLVDNQIEAYERMPQHALAQSASNYDVLSLLFLFKSLLSCD